MPKVFHPFHINVSEDVPEDARDDWHEAGWLDEPAKAPEEAAPVEPVTKSQEKQPEDKPVSGKPDDGKPVTK